MLISFRDTSIVPSRTETIPWIDLYETSPFGSAEFVVNLAQNVDAHAGSAGIEVPDVTPGSYFVMGLFSRPTFRTGASRFTSNSRCMGPEQCTLSDSRRAVCSEYPYPQPRHSMDYWRGRYDHLVCTHLLFYLDMSDKCLCVRDTSNLPDNVGQIPQFELWTDSSFGSGIFVTTLATDIDPTVGGISFPVPSDLTPGTYFIVGKIIVKNFSVYTNESCASNFWGQQQSSISDRCCLVQFEPK